MAKFFVGQRVRLVKPANPENMGIEGRIQYFSFYPSGTICIGGSPLKGDANCQVKYDLFDGVWSAHTDELEPITPDGHQPCESEFKESLDRLLERVEA